MSVIHYDFDFAIEPSGIVIASGTAEIAYDEEGNWWVEEIYRIDGKIHRRVNLESGSALYIAIVSALWEKCDESIVDQILAEDDDVANFVDSQKDEAQHRPIVL